MPIHTIKCSQIIHAPLERAWAFFADPRNLARITPPALGFRILSDLPPRIHPGMMIRYQVRPLLRLPMTWLTEITHVREERYFVDEQRSGPYRIWHHEHYFSDIGGGRVEMTDLVTYQLPLGWLSETK